MEATGIDLSGLPVCWQTAGAVLVLAGGAARFMFKHVTPKAMVALEVENARLKERLALYEREG